MEAMNRGVPKIAADPERAFTQDLVEYLRDEREEHDQTGSLQKRQEGRSVALGPSASKSGSESGSYGAEAGDRDADLCEVLKGLEHID